MTITIHSWQRWGRETMNSIERVRAYFGAIASNHGIVHKAETALIGYLFAYSVFTFLLASNLSLTWDEGSHTIAGIFVYDLAKDFLNSLPTSLSGTWLYTYVYGYISNYFAIFSSGFNYPPAYALVMAASFAAFGVNDFAARIVSTGFSFLALVFVYKLGRQVFGRAAAIASTVAFSLSFIFLQHSVLIMRDVPSTFAVLATLYYFLKSEQSGLNRPAFLAAASAFLGSMIKFPAALVFPIIFFYLLLKHRSFVFLRQKNVRILGCAFLGFLLYLALVLVFAGFFPEDSTERGTLIGNTLGWLLPGSEKLSASSAISSMGARVIAFYLVALLEVANWPLFLIGLVGLYGAFRNKNPAARVLLVLTAVYFVVFTLIPNKEPRFVFPMIAAFFLVAFNEANSLAKTFFVGHERKILFLLILSVALPSFVLVGNKQETIFTYANSYSTIDLDNIAKYVVDSFPDNSAVILASHDIRVNWVNFSFYTLKYDRRHSRKVTEFPVNEFDRRVQGLKGKGLPVYIVLYDGNQGHLWQKVKGSQGFELVKAFSQRNGETIELYGVK